ncbi:MAG: GrpB family protein [Bacteroidia bacterium]
MLIRPYQEQWEKDFQAIRDVLERNIRVKDIQIEHVGSTAVKYLAAKPIIDIDMVFAKPDDFGAIKTGLENIGYYHNGNQGIEGREVFKREAGKENHTILDSVSHHLYVCPDGSSELQRHLFFRDFLREHEKERLEYQKLKYEIAEKANQDRKVYAKLKEVLARDFVESILRQRNPS